MSLLDAAIDSAEGYAEDWAGKLLDEAAEAIADNVPEEYSDAPLGVVLALREHKAGIARAGSVGFARLITHVAAGDVSEAGLEIDRARTRAERKVARMRARLAAHEEREGLEDALGMLLSALKATGEALRIALPYLLQPILEDLRA